MPKYQPILSAHDYEVIAPLSGTRATEYFPTDE